MITNDNDGDDVYEPKTMRVVDALQRLERRK